MEYGTTVVRLPQTQIELPRRERLRLLARRDSIEVQHLCADGRIRGSLIVAQRIALARLLRHGGAKILSHRGRPQPLAVCRHGEHGYLLSPTLAFALPREAALAASAALDPNPDPLSPVGAREGTDWPARGFGHEETASIYVGDLERYIVSLIVGYEDHEVDSPLDAARAALALTTDENAPGTHWFVYDRATGRGLQLEQREFDSSLDPPWWMGVSTSEASES
jgi:hypothetical protein